MPASTTVLQRLLTVAAALSLIAAIGVNASVARAITAPTITILDISPSGDSYALDEDDNTSVAFNGGMLFQADNGTDGYELFKSDGTVAGTVLVKDINPSGDSYIDYMVVMGGSAYFQASDGSNGTELWKSDGTEAGTVMVKDINPSDSSSPRDFAVVGSTLYFRANDGTNGNELWKSDGTAAGTVMVKDINTGGDSYPNILAVAGSTLYFQADDGSNGYELWKSDGTAAGTVMVKDINTSGDTSSYPVDLTTIGSVFYFEAKNGDSVNGYELWKSDGTDAGTMMVKDIEVGSDGSSPDNLTRHGDLLYFFAYTAANGEELYLSDGTEVGTMRIPAPAAPYYVQCDCYDNPIQSTSVGVFFTYYDETVGHELGFISDPLPATNTSGNGLALALLALSGVLAAGAVIARRKELRAN